MIRYKFITEYDYSDAVPVAEFIADNLIALIERVCPPFKRVQPGQVVWLGVPKNLPRNQIGRRLRDLPLRPILLTVLTQEDERGETDYEIKARVVHNTIREPGDAGSIAAIHSTRCTAGKDAGHR